MFRRRVFGPRGDVVKMLDCGWIVGRLVLFNGEVSGRSQVADDSMGMITDSFASETDGMTG